MREVGSVELEHRPTDPQALRELANSQQAQDACKKTALAVRNDARRLAPVRTGNLRRHIVIEEYTDLDSGIDGYAVGWDDKGWYGWLVENGVERKPGRPHLVPAAIKNGVTLPGAGAA